MARLLRPERNLTRDRETYHRRTAVERRINRLKWRRGTASCFEKRLPSGRAMIVNASPIIRPAS